MANRISALHISDEEIRLLISKGEKIEKWLTIPLEPGMVKSGVVLEEEKVASLLRNRLALIGLNIKRVILSLSSTETLYRVINMPQLPMNLLPEAVKLEAAKVMPVPLEGFYLSYHAMPKSQNEIDVLLALYSKDVTDRLIKTIKKAGLIPQIMDLTPMVLCRLVQKPRAIVLHNHGKIIDIAIIVDRAPRVIRSLTLSGDISLLQSKLDSINEEVERTVAFYNASQTVENSIDSSVPCFVCGDLSPLWDSGRALSENFGYETFPLSVPLIAPASLPLDSYIINCALITKVVAPNLSAINFDALPEIHRYKGISMANIAIATGICVGILALGAMSFLYLNMLDEEKSLNARIGTTDGSINAMQNRIGELNLQIKEARDSITALEAFADSLGNKTAAIGQTRAVAAQDIIKINADIATIRQLVPPQVTLDSISLGPDIYTLTCNASGSNDIFRYARQLRDSKKFTATLVSSITFSDTFNCVIILSTR